VINYRKLKSVGYIILKRLPVINRLLYAIIFFVRTRNRQPVILPIKPPKDSVKEIITSGDLQKLFYDVSAISLNNEARGIHRVVINILKQLLSDNTSGFQVVTVRSTKNGIVTCKVDECKADGRIPPEIKRVNVKPGDIFISLDLYRKFNFTALQELRRGGLKVYFVIYDLLDIRTCCLGERDFITRIVARTARNSYKNWLHGVLSLSDGVVCDSNAIVNELLGWLGKNSDNYQRKIPLGFFHLGADFVSSKNVDHGISLEHSSTIHDATNRQSFLMVGVMDPHKGHMQAIHAFEQLWGNGINVNLIIVGKEGVLQPHIGKMIRRHAEYGHRLFWFGFVSDDVLSSLYNKCTALLAASFSEGFGLPLIEAAHYGLPVIARDIPVFREVAGTFAYYFKNNDASDIADAIVSWLSLAVQNKIPESCGMLYLDWAASTRQLLDIIINNRWCASWPVGDGGRRLFINDRAIISDMRNDR
jgi:glycosyltransferase involved in cell wall biosynthesis